MELINIILLIVGIFVIVWSCNSYLRMYSHKDSEYGKLYYIGLFVTLLSGIFWIVGIVTDYIGLFFLLIIILNLLLRLYIILRYPKKEIRYSSTQLTKRYNTIVKIRNISIISVFALIIVAFILKNV